MPSKVNGAKKLKSSAKAARPAKPAAKKAKPDAKAAKSAKPAAKPVAVKAAGKVAPKAIVAKGKEVVKAKDAKLKDVRIPRANLGPCPVCGHDITENRKGFSCWSRTDPGCGFVIWKNKAGKVMPPAVARELIQTGRTAKAVTGFKGRSGRSFRAKLALMQNDEGRWRVEFDEPWAKEGEKQPAVDEGEAAAKAAAALAAADAAAAAADAAA